MEFTFFNWMVDPNYVVLIKRIQKPPGTRFLYFPAHAVHNINEYNIVPSIPQSQTE